MISPVQLSACPSPPHTNKFWNNKLDFHEIQQKGHTTQGDPETIIFNTIASTIRTSEVDAKHEPHRLEL